MSKCRESCRRYGPEEDDVCPSVGSEVAGMCRLPRRLMPSGPSGAPFFFSRPRVAICDWFDRPRDELNLHPWRGYCAFASACRQRVHLVYRAYWQGGRGAMMPEGEGALSALCCAGRQRRTAQAIFYNTLARAGSYFCRSS